MRNSTWKSLRSLQPPITQNLSGGIDFLTITLGPAKTHKMAFLRDLREARQLQP